MVVQGGNYIASQYWNVEFSSLFPGQYSYRSVNTGHLEFSYPNLWENGIKVKGDSMVIQKIFAKAYSAWAAFLT